MWKGVHPKGALFPGKIVRLYNISWKPPKLIENCKIMTYKPCFISLKRTKAGSLRRPNKTFLIFWISNSHSSCVEVIHNTTPSSIVLENWKTPMTPVVQMAYLPLKAQSFLCEVRSKKEKQIWNPWLIIPRADLYQKKYSKV